MWQLEVAGKGWQSEGSSGLIPWFCLCQQATRCQETYGMPLARNTLSFLGFLRNCLPPQPPKILFF